MLYPSARKIQSRPGMLPIVLWWCLPLHSPCRAAVLWCYGSCLGSPQAVLRPCPSSLLNQTTFPRALLKPWLRPLSLRLLSGSCLIKGLPASVPVIIAFTSPHPSTLPLQSACYPKPDVAHWIMAHLSWAPRRDFLLHPLFSHNSVTWHPFLGHVRTASSLPGQSRFSNSVCWMNMWAFS